MPPDSAAARPRKPRHHRVLNTMLASAAPAARGRDITIKDALTTAAADTESLAAEP